MKEQLFKKMNWWDQLFWQLCMEHCGVFKRENGWKTNAFPHQGGGFSRVFACKRCFDTAEDAEEAYAGR